MKKFFLIIFILVDLAVIGLASAFLWARLHSDSGMSVFSSGALGNLTKSLPNIPGITPSAAPAAQPQAPVTPTTAPGGPATSSPLTSPQVPGQAPTGAGRKIGFSYRNSKVKKVMIRADFTGWRAEPMQKDVATSTWKYTAVLEPGEYAYCFSVDDKSIRDPANKHTKQVGKTFVSAIVVQALPAGKP